MERLFIDVSIAVRNLVRQTRRTAIALVSVAFGITALILANGFTERLFRDFREDVIRSQFGHLQIAKPGYQQQGKANPYAFLLPEGVPSALRDRPDIAVVAPRLSFSGLISRADSTLSFIGDGVDPNAESLFEAVQVSTGKKL